MFQGSVKQGLKLTGNAAALFIYFNVYIHFPNVTELFKKEKLV